MREKILEMEEYANEHNVPIIEKDSIAFIMKFIKANNVKSILEIGTAIGYSAILMAQATNDVVVTTIERDESRYMEALKNIKALELEDRITPIFKDALDVKIKDKFDLIFLDGAKGQNINFMEHFEDNLEHDGYFVTDNINFHGYVDKDENEIKSKNLRGLVRKIKAYKEYLINHDKYDTEFVNVGDGIAITQKKKEK